MVDGAAEENRAAMKPDDSGIQTHYIDALGKRHDSSPAALEAIRAAMRGRPADASRAVTRGRRTTQPATSGQDRSSTRSRFDDVLVVPEKTSEAAGAGDLELEDGTALTISEWLPADLPS